MQADVTRTRAERNRQEALLKRIPPPSRNVEAAVADEQRFTAQYASREADLAQARTVLRSNELAAEAERRSKAVLASKTVSSLLTFMLKKPLWK